MAVDDILYPLCKFDYDLVWLILAITPAIVVFLMVYNGIKLMSDNENTRTSGKKGIKNAIFGMILIIAFSGIGCTVLPGCVPCPGDAYNFPSLIASTTDPLNIWITSPPSGEVFTTGTAVRMICERSGGLEPVTVRWNFNEEGATVETSSCDTSHAYTEPGEYIISATAVDAEGRSATHKIKIGVKGPGSLSGSPLTVEITKPTTDPTYTATSSTVQFNCTASGGSGTYEYLWDFAGFPVMCSECRTDYGSFPSGGTYTVTITVTDSDSNTATDTVEITRTT